MCLEVAVPELRNVDSFLPQGDSHSTAEEKCNLVDDDGDGETDEEGAIGCAEFYKDEDGDGFGVSQTQCLCMPSPPFIAIKDGDCNDSEPTAHPGADEICHNETDEDCDGLLLPDCDQKNCGPDGCGSVCGQCLPEQICTDGVCHPPGCTADCQGKSCGDDGCGGSCGTCPPGQWCDGSLCQVEQCQPACDGKQCGDDGCGGSCGACPPGHICLQGLCNCRPLCQGMGCLPDGCGGVCAPCPPPPNNDPTRILFFTANVENLPEIEYLPPSCAGDWEDLFYFMRTQANPPDFLLVQQISNTEQLDYLATYMELKLGGSYGTIISEQYPEYWEPADCDFKKHQANGIIYRKERFQYIQGSKKTWRARIKKNGSCQVATAPRYLNLACKFTDKLSEGNKQLAVASIHWPVVDGCGVTNAQLTQDSLKSYTGVEMYAWGGDVNLPDLTSQSASAGYKPWYKKANVELAVPDNVGYRDPVWHNCHIVSVDEEALKTCLIANGTLGAGVQPRYDYLFFKYANDYKPGDAVNPPPVEGVHTIGFEVAGSAQYPDDSPLPYSKHRAVRAYVHW